ncbi:hypothetical protein OGAPHI_002911 [Ogataea philodendri]|uniref:Uncharacterized protein n=1 Tax=Ogataea philodendri TaxID=1378263 RepID=A0A9P8P8F3_9ASCO|nr:uncharacterized protein OGAPHI_002911 [Ogataea philodendri]KAH3667262.1 hypothetical protein OGAPHI_002911 [Ogataea philodendri]
MRFDRVTPCLLFMSPFDGSSLSTLLTMIISSRSVNQPFLFQNRFVWTTEGAITSPEIMAITSVKQPSMINSHCHPVIPKMPLIRRIPYASSAVPTCVSDRAVQKYDNFIDSSLEVKKYDIQRTSSGVNPPSSSPSSALVA